MVMPSPTLRFWFEKWRPVKGNPGDEYVDIVGYAMNWDSGPVAQPTQRICGGGGRVIWNDAGNTPNLHFVCFDTGSIPVVIGLTNLRANPESKKSPEHPGPGSGYIAYCEGGHFEGQRGPRHGCGLDYRAE